MPSCRILPQGSYSLVPTVLTTMGWLASLFQDGCDYSRLTGDIVGKIAVQPKTPWLEVGFAAYREPLFNTETGEWEVVYQGRCVEYPAEHVEMDQSWKVAKGFAFLALVLGGGGTFFLWFNTCCVFSRGSWRWAGYEVLLASIFQALSFLWFNTGMCQDSNNNCSLFWGSKTDIVATVLWFIAALSIFCYYPQPREMRERDGLMVDPANQSRSAPQSPSAMNENPTRDDGLRQSADGKPREDDESRSSTPETMASGEDPKQNASEKSEALQEVDLV